jgi:hypothetical protein
MAARIDAAQTLHLAQTNDSRSIQSIIDMSQCSQSNIAWARKCIASDEHNTFRKQNQSVFRRRQLTLCASVANPSQMKLTKMNSNSRNMMNKEFQHLKEFWFIWEPSERMQMIQCAAVANHSQMKSMKGVTTLKTWWTKDFGMSQDCDWSDRLPLKRVWSNARDSQRHSQRG